MSCKQCQNVTGKSLKRLIGLKLPNLFGCILFLLARPAIINAKFIASCPAKKDWPFVVKSIFLVTVIMFTRHQLTFFCLEKPIFDRKKLELMN